MSHYKDTGTYQTSSVMESKMVFFVAQMGNFSCHVRYIHQNLTRTLPAEA